MKTSFQDLRFGLRLLRANPAFTLVAVLTLALGLASSTTVFSWVDAILVRPYPGAADAHRLALLEMVSDSAPTGANMVSWLDYLDYQSGMRSLSGPAGHREDVFNIGDQRQAQPVLGEVVTGSYFTVLGLRPAAGQFFSYADRGARLGDYPLAVISHRLWRQRFQADPSVIGKPIRVNRRQLTIAAVAPPEFRGTTAGLAADVWVPLAQAVELNIFSGAAFTNRGAHGLYVVARLRDGVTRAQANAEAATLSRHLEAAYRDTNRGFHAVVLPVWGSRTGAGELLLRPLGILMAVSVLVLLIACANVANLLLVRSVARSRETAIRLALGAGRARLVRQMLTETLLLAGAGALLAIPLTGWMAEALPNLAPRIGSSLAAAVDWNSRMLGFTALLCFLSTLLAAAAPVMLSLRTGLSETLKQGTRGGGAGVQSHRVRGLLVVAEVALATVALVAAGLFLRSFHNAGAIYPGFDRENVLLSRFYPASTGYSTEDLQRFGVNLARRLEETPGQTGVCYADYAPLGSNAGPYHRLAIDGYTPARNESMEIGRTYVSPAYFRTLHIPLAEGREFTLRDDGKAPPVLIVNRAFARKYFGGATALGRRVTAYGQPHTIVGVVGDFKYYDVTETPRPHFFAPFLQRASNSGQLYFYLRHSGDEAAAAAAVRRAVAALDPLAGAFHTMPLLEWTRVTLFPQRVAASMLAALGLISLLLAAVGLYSVMAYSVSRQTREIGIRMALGARAGSVFGGVLRRGLTLTAAGLALGAALAWTLARLVGAMLVGIRATDPLVFAGAALFLLSVAALANYFPARRATRVDPVRALRCE